MKKFYFLTVAVLITAAALAQTTYTWIGANNAQWNTSTNWSPTRSIPAASDILQFNDGTTKTVTNVQNQTIGRLLITNNTSMTFSGGGGGQTVTVGNGTGDDFVVASGSSLTQNSSFETLTLAASSTADISGTYVIIGTFNLVNANVVATVTGTIDNRSTISNATTAKLVFQNSATYLHALNAGNVPVATWNSSLMKITGVTNTLPGGLAQTFGNVEWNCPSQTTEESFSTDMSAVTGNFTVTSTGTGSIRYSNASTMTINIGGNLSISGGTFRFANTAGAGIKTYNIGGSFIQSGGTFDPDGNATTVAHHISVGGDWTRNGGTFNADATTVTFNGTAAQVIGGTQATTFTNLTINNASGVSLGNNVTTTGVLALTNGLLSTSAANLLTMNAGSSYTGGNSNASFINGPIAKLGATAFVFPVGKSGAGIRTIAISAPTASSTFTAEFLRANPNTVVGTNRAAGLANISYCEYWTLDRTAGAGNASVTISWSAGSSCSSAPYVGNLATLKVAHWNGSIWLDEGQGANTGNTTAGTITTAAALTSFSPFTLGSSALDNALPVMFADVKGFERNNGVQIEWTNLTERDLTNYIVERSANGTNFSEIGQQTPRSNYNDKQTYSLFDAAPLAGTNFYRVKVLEIGGKIIYSKVIRVETAKSGQGFTLYPNPVKGNVVSVLINNNPGQYTLKIATAGGQEVYSKRINHQGGSMTQTLELPSGVKPGVYNITISGANYREAKMFVVQ